MKKYRDLTIQIIQVQNHLEYRYEHYHNFGLKDPLQIVKLFCEKKSTLLVTVSRRTLCRTLDSCIGRPPLYNPHIKHEPQYFEVRRGTDVKIPPLTQKKVNKSTVDANYVSLQ